jgi:hypothetical protein
MFHSSFSSHVDTFFRLGQHLTTSSHVDTFLQAWATSNNFNFQILLFAHVTKLRICESAKAVSSYEVPKMQHGMRTIPNSCDLFFTIAMILCKVKLDGELSSTISPSPQPHFAQSILHIDVL